ncbi:MAG: FtsH protease activity modulator HflK [Treponema sp.]|jgi:membrane protease subunit HflK|nr:FtsH protease activity modulator HflK [Treponema sp.]
MALFTPPRAGKLLRPGTFVIGIIVIAVIIFLGTSFYIVDQAEQAVVTRFGKYLTTTGPGLRYKLPFGIDRTYIVNTSRVMTEEFGFRTVSRSGRTPAYTIDNSTATMLTGDLNMVVVEWVIQYRIADPFAWTFNVYDRERTIQDVSRSVINMLVGDRAIMDIMGVERSNIELRAEEYMNETFTSFGLGIRVIAVKLQNIDPPVAVQDAFDDVNRAIQDMNRLINEGQQAYNEQIPRTRGEADRMIQVAEGYATERVNHAYGDVARFNAVYEEYRLSSDVTRRRLYYEMIEDVFKDLRGTTVIDRNLDNFLPLMNLGGR